VGGLPANVRVNYQPASRPLTSKKTIRIRKAKAANAKIEMSLFLMLSKEINLLGKTLCYS